MESTGKRTRHFDIKLFYIADLVRRRQVDVRYCPTEKMIADYLSKPLTGSKLQTMRRWLLNLDSIHLPVVQQECVGE